MPYYYRSDGRWLEVPFTDESVQEVGDWHHDGRRLYRLLTAERCERLKEWVKDRPGDVADSLRRLIAEYSGESETENAAEKQDPPESRNKGSEA